MIRDRRTAAESLQWAIIAAGASLSAVTRVVLDRLDQRGQDSEADVVKVELAVSEERCRLLAEHSHDALWTTDPATGRFTDVGPSILTQRGGTLEETPRARLPGLRVLFVSGYARAGLGARALAAPHTAFLAKPFTAEGLLAQVRALLDG